MLIVYLVNSKPASGMTEFKTTVWPDQRIYELGERVTVYFSCTVSVDRAELSYWGRYSETRLLNFTGPGVGSIWIGDLTSEHIGNWTVEFKVSISGQMKTAYSSFTIVAQRTWADDFNYPNLQQFWEEGWYPWWFVPYTENRCISIINGNLSLEWAPGDEGDPAILHDVAPILGSDSLKVLDWRIETKAMWTGRQSGGFAIVVWTESNGSIPNHRYSFGLDGVDQSVWLSKNYAKIATLISDWNPLKDRWYSIVFERKGSTYYVYIDGVLIQAFEEVGTEPTPIINFGVNVMWNSIDVFDFVSFEALNLYYLEVFSSHGSPVGSGTFYEGDEAYFSVTSPIDYGNGTRHIFLEWIGALNRTSEFNSVIMNKSIWVTANWRTQFYLSVESIYGISYGTGWYDLGTTVSCSIDPVVVDYGNRTRHVFVEWINESGSTNSTVLVTVDEPTSVRAIWKKQYYLLVESSHDNTNGTGWHDAGKYATFSTDKAIWEGLFVHDFKGWSGDSDKATSRTNIYMNSPYEVVAEWETSIGILSLLLIMLLIAPLNLGISVLVMKRGPQGRSRFTVSTLLGLFTTLFSITSILISWTGDWKELSIRFWLSLIYLGFSGFFSSLIATLVFYRLQPSAPAHATLNQKRTIKRIFITILTFQIVVFLVAFIFPDYRTISSAIGILSWIGGSLYALFS